MPIKACNERCSGCALTKGAEANLEPDNYLKANLAVMGPFPFYCHATIDYSTLKPGLMSRQEFRERGMMLCTGWLEEVRKLAATGYYDDNPMITKALAKLADENLSIFIASGNREDKREAMDVLHRVLGKLVDKRRRFEDGRTDHNV